MERSSLGVGIIGAGNIIGRHARAYRSLPELAQLIAVADIDKKRADSAKRAYGFKASYQDHRELLARDDVQVVSVCTPAQHHAEIVIDALEAGKHVLCEKPMAHTLEEADAIIAAADRNSKVRASFVYQYRSEPAHMRIRGMIERGLLGRVLSGSVRVLASRMPAYYAAVPGRGSWKSDGGGVLINQAIHQLDALILFLGEPVEVSAVMDTFVQPTEGEDTLAAWIKFKSGALATVRCTVCAHDDWFAIDVLGENASSGLRGGPDAKSCTWSLESRSAAVQRGLRRTGLKKNPDLPKGPGLWRVRAQKVMCKLRGREWLPPRHWGHTPHIQQFLEAVRSAQNPPVPPREARRSLELAVAIYDSALNKKHVTLPIGADHAFYAGVCPTRQECASTERGNC